ncbi:MAG: radical SAM protein [Candidatus Tantalella remota]|nr:radical SAM protein [Candidatus Tantalella remota]
MKKRPFPTGVDLALTGRCNLKCKHCNTSDTWDSADELSFKEIVSLLDQLKELKIFSLDLFGGEPFCYPRICEMLDILNSYPMRLTVLTNGTLIDEKIVRHLKTLRFLGVIQVSIDGASPEVHDWQRGEGSFEKAMRGLKLLIDNGLPVTIKAMLNRHNYTDIENIADLAVEMGLGSISLGDAVECGKAAVYGEDMRFEAEVHREIIEGVLRLHKKYPGFGIGGTIGQKIDMLKDFYAKGPGNGDRGNFSTCPAGQSTLSIRADGKVVPCSAFWTYVCGDIREQKLEDIWQNSERLNEIRALADEPLTDHCAECRECDYMTYCNGGCRAAAYYMSGNDIRGIDPSTCLAFSNRHGTRVPPEKLLSVEEGK